MKLFKNIFLIAFTITQYNVIAQSPNCFATLKKYEQTSEGQKLTNCIEKGEANDYSICDIPECRIMKLPSFEKDCSSIEDEMFVNSIKLTFDEYKKVLDSKCPSGSSSSTTNIAKSESRPESRPESKSESKSESYSNDIENKLNSQAYTSQNTKTNSTNLSNSDIGDTQSLINNNNNTNITYGNNTQDVTSNNNTSTNTSSANKLSYSIITLFSFIVLKLLL